MITSIEIQNLRGIRSGRLDGLLPLTILTGPNGCGKSTVLDALLICASPTPGGAIGRAVQRHPATLGGSRWLLGRPEEDAIVRGMDDGENRWEIHLGCSRQDEGRLNCSQIRFRGEGLGRQCKGLIGFDIENKYKLGPVSGEAISTIPFVRLVDPGLPVRLHETFSAVARTPRRKEVENLLKELIPNFRQLEILTEGNEPIVHVTTKTSMPVALAGDGIQSLVQLVLEIAAAPGGLVLVEEPDVYQHPKTIRQTARALVANVRRGIQIVLTTHSLELMDALLAEAEEEDLARMAVFNLWLDDGQLRYGRRAGEKIAFARNTLGTDVR